MPAATGFSRAWMGTQAQTRQVSMRALLALLLALAAVVLPALAQKSGAESVDLSNLLSKLPAVVPFMKSKVGGTLPRAVAWRVDVGLSSPALIGPAGLRQSP